MNFKSNISNLILLQGIVWLQTHLLFFARFCSRSLFRCLSLIPSSSIHPISFNVTFVNFNMISKRINKEKEHKTRINLVWLRGRGSGGEARAVKNKMTNTGGFGQKKSRWKKVPKQNHYARRYSAANHFGLAAGHGRRQWRTKNESHFWSRQARQKCNFVFEQISWFPWSKAYLLSLFCLPMRWIPGMKCFFKRLGFVVRGFMPTIQEMDLFFGWFVIADIIFAAALSNGNQPTRAKSSRLGNYWKYFGGTICSRLRPTFCVSMNAKIKSMAERAVFFVPYTMNSIHAEGGHLWTNFLIDSPSFPF